MNRQPFRKSSSQILDAFGFQITGSDDGHRLWILVFKRFVAGKLAAKEMMVADVKAPYKFWTSQIYQWKTQVVEKGGQSRPWRKSYQMFKEGTLLEERRETTSVEDVAPTVSLIRVQGRYTAFCIPADYPVDALLAVLKVLDGDR